MEIIFDAIFGWIFHTSSLWDSIIHLYIFLKVDVVNHLHKWRYAMPLSIILYAIFGYLGIYFSNKIEFLKKFNNKKNLISLSAIFFLYIAIFFKLVVDPEYEGVPIYDLFGHMVRSLGNFAALFLGSVLIILIRTKFKKIFNEEFYFALFGGIIFGTLVLTLIESFIEISLL